MYEKPTLQLYLGVFLMKSRSLVPWMSIFLSSQFGFFNVWLCIVLVAFWSFLVRLEPNYFATGRAPLYLGFSPTLLFPARSFSEKPKKIISVLSDSNLKQFVFASLMYIINNLKIFIAVLFFGICPPCNFEVCTLWTMPLQSSCSIYAICRYLISGSIIQISL